MQLHLFPERDVVEKYNLKLISVGFFLNLRHKAQLSSQMPADHITQGSVNPAPVKCRGTAIDEYFAVC